MNVSFLVGRHRLQRITEALVRDHPADRVMRRALAHAYESSGYALSTAGKGAEAVANLRRAAGMYEELAVSDVSDAQGQVDAAVCYNGLGDALGNESFVNVGDTASALDSYKRALAHYETAVRIDSKNQRARRGLAIGYVKIGDVHLQGLDGQLVAAQEMFEKGLAIFKQLSSDEPGNADLRRSISVGLGRVGKTLLETGEFEKALDRFREGLAIEEAMVSVNPKNAQARWDLAVGLRDLADALKDHGETVAALDSYRKILSLMEALSAEAPDNIQWRSGLSEMLVLLGTLTAQQGHVSEARRMTTRGLQMEKALAERAEASPDEVKLYAEGLLDCEPADLHNASLALEYARRAVEISGGKNPLLLDLLARAYFRNGRATEASETEEKALSLLPAPGPEKPFWQTRRRFEANLDEYRNSRQRG